MGFIMIILQQFTPCIFRNRVQNKTEIMDNRVIIVCRQVWLLLVMPVWHLWWEAVKPDSQRQKHCWNVWARMLCIVVLWVQAKLPKSATTCFWESQWLEYQKPWTWEWSELLLCDIVPGNEMSCYNVTLFLGMEWLVNMWHYCQPSKKGCFADKNYIVKCHDMN